jgi:hypothetical protein
MKLNSMCTDGAPAMLGIKSGFTTLVKTIAPQSIGIYCFLHLHALAARTLPQSFNSVMNDIIAMVNFIKGSSLNYGIFKNFCNELGAKHYSSSIIQKLDGSLEDWF